MTTEPTAAEVREEGEEFVRSMPPSDNFFRQSADQDEVPEAPEVEAEEEPKEEKAPSFDPNELASSIHRATLSALEQNEARKEARKEQPPPEPPPKREPPKIDPERFLSDEKYALDAVDKIAAHRVSEAEGQFRPTIDDLTNRTQILQSILSAVVPSATKGAYESATDIAMRRGLVETREEFASLGQAIGQILNHRVQAGQANQLVMLDPEEIYRAADYAVREMGVKPVKPKTKPQERGIGAGDRGGSKRGEPKINEGVFSAVEQRLGIKIPKERKLSHARHFARRSA